MTGSEVMRGLDAKEKTKTATTQRVRTPTKSASCTASTTKLFFDRYLLYHRKDAIKTPSSSANISARWVCCPAHPAMPICPPGCGATNRNWLSTSSIRSKARRTLPPPPLAYKNADILTRRRYAWDVAGTTNSWSRSSYNKTVLPTPNYQLFNTPPTTSPSDPAFSIDLKN